MLIFQPFINKHQKSQWWLILNLNYFLILPLFFYNLIRVHVVARLAYKTIHCALQLGKTRSWLRLRNPWGGIPAACQGHGGQEGRGWGQSGWRPGELRLLRPQEEEESQQIPNQIRVHSWEGGKKELSWPWSSGLDQGKNWVRRQDLWWEQALDQSPRGAGEESLPCWEHVFEVVCLGGWGLSQVFKWGASWNS